MILNRDEIPSDLSGIFTVNCLAFGRPVEAPIKFAIRSGRRSFCRIRYIMSSARQITVSPQGLIA